MFSFTTICISAGSSILLSPYRFSSINLITWQVSNPLSGWPALASLFYIYFCGLLLFSTRRLGVCCGCCTSSPGFFFIFNLFVSKAILSLIFYDSISSNLTTFSNSGIRCTSNALILESFLSKRQFDRVIRHKGHSRFVCYLLL